MLVIIVLSVVFSKTVYFKLYTTTHPHIGHSVDLPALITYRSRSYGFSALLELWLDKKTADNEFNKSNLTADKDPLAVH